MPACSTYKSSVTINGGEGGEGATDMAIDEDEQPPACADSNVSGNAQQGCSLQGQVGWVCACDMVCGVGVTSSAVQLCNH
jgi:hypothetical protein